MTEMLDKIIEAIDNMLKFTESVELSIYLYGPKSNLVFLTDKFDSHWAKGERPFPHIQSFDGLDLEDVDAINKHYSNMELKQKWSDRFCYHVTKEPFRK